MDTNITITGLLFEFISNNKYIIYLYIVFLVISTFKDIGIPHLFGKLIRSIEDKTSILPPLIWLSVCTIVVHLSFSLIDYLQVDTYPKLQAFIRNKIITYLMSINNENYSELETSKIISKLMRFPMELYFYFNQWRYTFVPSLILSVVAAIYFVYYDKIIGIGLALLLIFVWTILYFSVGYCTKYSYPTETVLSNLAEHVDDIMRNMMTVLNTSQQKTEIKSIDDLESKYSDLVKQTLNCSLVWRYAIIPFNILYFVFFIYTGYQKVKSKQLKASVFIALVIIMFRVFNAIWSISGVINDIVTRWGILQQSLEIFTINKDATQPTQQHIIQTNSHIPKNGFFFDNVSFKYSSANEYTLRNVTLHIAPNDIILITGRNGTGKTTILKLLMKLLTPTQGELYYNAKPYSSLSSGELRKDIGYIAQYPLLFNRTIFENIVYGLDNIHENDIQQLISSLNLSNIFSNLSQGIHTPVGKHGSNLSGGQKQIVWLLHIILQNPDIIIMDEPTVSIDKDTKEHIYNLLKTMMQNKTVMMVTHDDYLKQFATKILYLENGNLVTKRK